MMLGNEFVHELLNNPLFVGEIVEFGTGSGGSAEWINLNLSGSKRITTFDGFIGLPKTEKVIPKYTDWFEGNFNWGERNVRERLKKSKNITVIKTMMADLKEPEDYGIVEVAAANMDLDLYEGTLEALRFVDKCVWKNILLRFDDWGAYPHQVKEEVAQHEEAAFFDFLKDKDYQYTFYDRYNQSVHHQQAIVALSRGYSCPSATH